MLLEQRGQEQLHQQHGQSQSGSAAARRDQGWAGSPGCTAVVLAALPHVEEVATGAAGSAPPPELGSAGLAAGRAPWPLQKVKLQSQITRGWARQS